MKPKNQLTFAGDYSCRQASGNYGYSKDLSLLNNNQEQISKEDKLKRLASLSSPLNEAPGLIKSGLERFLHKYPN